jgi:ubiquinone/menaquinone biosynthesis C-methylase UbiE
LADFKDKAVLDIGSGTGRLALAAAPLAMYVYASEPTVRFREYLKDKLKRLNIQNVYVIDGTIESLPFPDGSFDIVMSGHVIGDDYEAECREMGRVTKPGGWIVDCPGEDDRPNTEGMSSEMRDLGFSGSQYKSKNGGDVYRYRKQKPL